MARERIVRKTDPDEELKAEEAEDLEDDEVEEDTESEEAEDLEDDEADTPPAKVAAPARKIVVPPPAAKPGAKPVAKVAAPAAPAKKVVVPPPAAKAAPVKPGAAKPVAAKPTLPAKKAAPVVEEQVEPEEAVEAPAAPLTKVKKLADTQGELLLGQLVASLREHESLIFTRTSDNKFSVSLGDAKTVTSSVGKLTGQAFLDEVLSPEYVTWQAEWKQMTDAEKHALCKKNKIEWDHSTQPQVEAIRMADAYRTAMGIEKYKPEYKERKVRDTLHI